MKVLLTGATGFIGSHLAKSLSKQNFELWSIVRSAKKAKVLEDIGSHLIYADITDYGQIQKILAGLEFDYVFHLAALTKVPRINKRNLDLFYKVNVEGTRNLLECFKDKKIKKFIYFSSIDVSGFTVGDSDEIKGRIIDESFIGNPKRPYEITKAKAEKVVKFYQKEVNIPTVIIRPGIVYGEGRVDLRMMRAESAFFKMCEMIQKKIYPIFGPGENYFPLVYVSNVILGTLLAAQSDKAIGQIYILTDQKTYTMNEIVKIIANELGVNYKGIHLPLGLSKIGATFLEIIFSVFKKAPPITRTAINYWTSDRVFSSAKAQEELGYQPIDLKEGVKRTISWYKKNGYLK
jgi:UDP-glucose 4-epimerase